MTPKQQTQMLALLLALAHSDLESADVRKTIKRFLKKIPHKEVAKAASTEVRFEP